MCVGWKCDMGNGEFDHDWQYIADWYGDPEVINGQADVYFKRCAQCGAEEGCDAQEYYAAVSHDPDDGDPPAEEDLTT